MSPTKDPISLAINLTLHDTFQGLLASEMGIQTGLPSVIPQQRDRTELPDEDDGARALVSQVTIA